jgi:outer membrane protein
MISRRNLFHRRPTARRTAFRRAAKRAPAVLLLLLATAAAPVVAQAPKLGVIDVERILTDSVRGKKALEELTKLRDQKNTELQTMRTEVEQMRSKYAESRLTLAEDKLAEMERQLEDKAVDLRRAQDDAQREVQKKQQEEFARIEREVMPIIQTVGKENGYTLIFNKFQGGLVFADDSVDVTDLVIERFNAAPGSGQ